MKPFVTHAVAAALCVGLADSPVHVQVPAPQEPEALQGLDPVVLVTGKEVFGKSALFVVHDGLTYIFSTAENKTAFARNPERYAVQDHGMCARMGAPVGGNPELFTVHEGRIYLFGSEECVKRFTATPSAFLHRPEPVPAVTAESARNARALLDKAAEGLGGAARVDGLSALRSVVVTVPPPLPEGSTMRPREPQTTSTVVALPGALWQEFRMGTMSSVSVVTPDAAFRAGQGGVRDMRPGQGQAMFAAATRSPIFLVRARRDPSIAAWSAGHADVGGTSAEVVGLARGDERFTLAIDPGSGRVVRFSYIGRGPDGVVGEVVETYTDFKDAGDGIVLPHSVARTFKGAPFGQAFAFQRLEANPAIDPAIFVRPAAK